MSNVNFPIIEGIKKAEYIQRKALKIVKQKHNLESKSYFFLREETEKT